MHYLSKQLKVHLLCSCFNSTSIKNVWLFSTMRTFKIAHVLDQPKYLLENKVKFSFPYCKGTEIVNSYIITINRLKETILAHSNVQILTGTWTFWNMFAPRLASINAISWGVETIIAPAITIMKLMKLQERIIKETELCNRIAGHLCDT